MRTRRSGSGRARLIATLLALVALISVGAGGSLGARGPLGAAPQEATSTATNPRPTIVLVHGDWADGSSWASVIARLQRKGFTVAAPPNLLRGPATDAPYLASYVASISGPVVLVGHSYGGFVATNAATGNDNVRAIVYINALAPDEGETAGELAARGGSCVSEAGLIPVPYAGGVDLYLRWEADSAADPPYIGFRECFANGVGGREAAILHAVQRPAGAAQFTEPSGPPAWNAIPAWYLIGTQDRVIPPALQEEMASRAGAHITRVRAGHLTPITRPAVVTDLILAAVAATN
jgi:pimeloyl-ACP methyl ester carboxylesterase